MPQKRKKKKKNEIIKLSQLRLSKLKEGFVGLLQFLKKDAFFDDSKKLLFIIVFEILTLSDMS